MTAPSQVRELSPAAQVHVFHFAYWPKAAECVLGRASPPCPGISDLDLFRYRERIVDLDAEVSDGAFDFGVAKQKLHGP